MNFIDLILDGHNLQKISPLSFTYGDFDGQGDGNGHGQGGGIFPATLQSHWYGEGEGDKGYRGFGLGYMDGSLAGPNNILHAHFPLWKLS